MSIYEHLPPRARTTEGSGMDEEEGQAALRLCNLVAQSPGDAERRIQTGGREGTDGKGDGTVGDYLLCDLKAVGMIV